MNKKEYELLIVEIRIFEGADVVTFSENLDVEGNDNVGGFDSNWE